MSIKTGNIYHIGYKKTKGQITKWYIKVGNSNNCNARKTALQTGNHNKLELFNIFQTHVAQKVEKVLHKKFKKYRANGEWFIFNNDAEYEMCIKCSNHITDIVNYIYTHYSSQFKLYLSTFINNFASDEYCFEYTFATIDNLEICDGKIKSKSENIIKQHKEENIKKIECKFCGDEFKHISSKCTHELHRCKKRFDNKIDDDCDIDNKTNLREVLINKDNIISDLISINKDLISINKGLKYLVDLDNKTINQLF